MRPTADDGVHLDFGGHEYTMVWSKGDGVAGDLTAREFKAKVVQAA